MRVSPFLTVLVLFLPLTACGKKKKPAGPPPFEELCAKSCERVRSCHEEIDGEECRLDCVNALMPYGARLRAEFVQEIQQCMLDSRCRDLGTGALDNSCRKDATERLGVSLKTIHMCDALNDTLVRCTLGSPGTEGCQQSFKILNDDTLAEATHCRDVECKELGQCFTAALGFSTPMPPVISPAGDDDEQEQQ
jgi:hypothetical protein